MSAHLDNSPLAVVEFDPQLRVTRWSKQAERVFGWSAEEIVGRAIPELRWVHEEDGALVGEVTGRDARRIGQGQERGRGAWNRVRHHATARHARRTGAPGGRDREDPAARSPRDRGQRGCRADARRFSGTRWAPRAHR
ncbi:MAG TPA: PAS domain-containing protein [Candidatus Methylomirabilis sp.]|nr:PAS domain-containing protein [Candidatus Methylomirabilis sp.]